MSNVDVNYFCDSHIHRNEKIVATIECVNEGNPFPGTLILTDFRLFFSRKGPPGTETTAFKLNNISTADFRIEGGMNFVLVVSMPSFDHHFEIRAIDEDKKREFVELVQKQMDHAKPAPIETLSSSVSGQPGI